MHIIFPSCDLVKDVVSQHLVVFNYTAHLQFLYSICYVQLLWLVVPGQAVDLKGQDLLCQLIEVCLNIVDLHLENYNRFCNWLGFFRFLSWLGRLGSWLSSRGIIISKGVKIILFLLFFLLLFLFLVVLLAFGFILFCPSLNDDGTEVAEEEIPVVEVGVSSSVGEFYMMVDVLPRAR